LAKLGVSSALAHHYLKSGWLVRLGRGVFMFPNDALRREDCLKFLSRRVTGFHVGSKTALVWRAASATISRRANPGKFTQQAEELRERLSG
jgi:hypothetical protein